ncbi:MAG TPA: sigma-70 family RNA polymerase sigma factor [Streptosporangiaceae bacterium]
MRMYDREIVAAIVEGDPAGLAAAYDQYARGLHAYCRSMLSEPADAADAVQDTFVIASSKVGGLREPERLRAWLYAVARNECHRRLRAKTSSAPLDEAAEMMDYTEDVGVDAERAELRALVWAALSGLNSGEREIIELNLRHELDGADLADALGVPRNQAHALASRARSQFETSLGVLLVARSGREFCMDLANILEGWDGELTVLIRKRVNRHIDRCEVCGERKRRELSPAMLLSLLPVAMLPANLRDQIFRLVADVSPGAATYRARVAHRAEPFGASGFPQPISTPSAARWQGNYALAAVAVVAALALLGGGGVLFTDFVTHGGSPAAAGTPAQPGSTGSSGPGALVVTPSASPLKTSHKPSPTPTPGLPAPLLTAPIPAVQPPPPVPIVHPSTPHSTKPPPPPPPTTSPPTTPPASGTMTVTPPTVQLVLDPNGLPTGSFTIAATGGPVTYSLSVPSPLTVSVTAPALRPNVTLPAGTSVTVTVGVAAGAKLTAQAVITVTQTNGAATAVNVTVLPVPPLT